MTEPLFAAFAIARFLSPVRESPGSDHQFAALLSALIATEQHMAPTAGRLPWFPPDRI
jgi:hypothetical protein